MLCQNCHKRNATRFVYKHIDDTKPICLCKHCYSQLTQKNRNSKKHYNGNTLFNKKAKLGHISTGLSSLDKITNGGFPKGRISEIYGMPSVGKSTLALTCIANAQRKNLKCAYIDAENALNLDYAEKLGINKDKLLTMMPQTCEQGLNGCINLINNDNVDLIIIDSVNALTPKADFVSSVLSSSTTTREALLFKYLPKISRIAKQNNVAIILVNNVNRKLRNTCDLMDGLIDEPHSHVLTHFDTLWLRIYPGTKLKKFNHIIGSQVRIRNMKDIDNSMTNKICRVNMYYGCGFSKNNYLATVRQHS